MSGKEFTLPAAGGRTPNTSLAQVVDSSTFPAECNNAFVFAGYKIDRYVVDSVAGRPPMVFAVGTGNESLSGRSDSKSRLRSRPPVIRGVRTAA